LCQFFNVFNARSSEHSAFHRLFSNGWLWIALATSLALQLAVVYVPGLQRAFSTTALAWTDWASCVTLASSVLWVSELAKLARRVFRAAPRASETRARTPAAR
jgi:Ca2+-transporting ATPase